MKIFHPGISKAPPSSAVHLRLMQHPELCFLGHPKKPVLWFGLSVPLSGIVSATVDSHYILWRPAARGSSVWWLSGLQKTFYELETRGGWEVCAV
ncbi:SCA7-domain-containing protein [Colletotrichum scovillei]|uniref:SCA7-domain-containing protein n=1 Tax=Colletotrichum scovillei TaxID=1209932 RepID=A0A9P7QX25_9PEZI|nr:SCA7-domain-containing protein [Colletotrichum scovillei]KAG7049497.1 SCA7-domain-containing protein [Colletotrichum scovillei]KAG7064236.1 SCA7-domain-containing protein [Colletotrichum scovillei]